jgi:hypothetical protein
MTDRSKYGLQTAAFWHEEGGGGAHLADDMTDPRAKATMKAIAVMYDSMAKQAAEREAKAGRQPG